ncbi:FAD/NAD(P)-binding domain-containing protein [Exidia glandulosa HHB12029]|uniref:FAD/NAD(P)-binding domain-containing protein n=1 Tax=Exidia glandulosa HHB12029 TaxID=1314781 RepID=A0A165ZNU6_EXIGL|nr:FAD/NAD(P)-binding domain-containing protein [Exidia glandulosa HHB12029]
MTSAPRIAIIGGGPGGLILLNVLARHNVTATLYERDAEFSSRAHLGGTLDLHEDTGQLAMKGAGAALWDAFVKHSRPEGEEVFITDKSGETLFHHAPPPNVANPARPEIDRSTLRKILLDGAPEGSIKWGHGFVSATPVAGTAQWELAFANGHTAVVDLMRWRRGANVAMYAGLKLGLAIAEAATVENMDQAVAKYEQDVRKIVVDAAAMSEANMKRARGPNGAQSMIKAFATAFPTGVEQPVVQASSLAE